jgi:hypothetical protein
MGLDIWFAEDIRNALLAANEASAATAAVIAEVGRAPSTGSGQRPSTGSGQAPSASSGQAPSASSGQAPSSLRRAQGSGQAVTDSTDLLTVSLRAYREGYKAALATLALAFGIAPQAITLRQAQDSALRQAQDSALRPFDSTQGRQAQDRGLRVETQGEIFQPLHIPGSGEEA